MVHENEDFVAENTPPLGADSLAQPDNMSTAEGKYGGERTFVVEQSPTAILTYWITNLRGNDSANITAPVLTIGRASTCDLVLDDKKISRLHAKIINKSGTVVVEDAGSQNGTYINGHRIKRVVLVDGDLIQIGDQTFSFDLEKRLFTNNQIETLLAGRRPAQMPGGASARQIWLTRKRILGATAIAIAFMVLSVAWLKMIGRSPVPVAIAQVERAGEIERTGLGVAPSLPNKELPAVVDLQPQEVVAPEGTGQTVTIALPEVSLKKEAPAQLPYLSGATSRAQIEKAKAKYLRGEAEDALDSLAVVVESRTHRASYRKEAEALAVNIKRLYDKYSSGLEKYGLGSHDQAFGIWDNFIQSEQAAFGNEESFYANHVAELVAGKYLSLGDDAMLRGDKRQAYTFWRSSTLVSPDGEATKRLDKFKAEVARLFNDAYRLETAELEAAKALWNEVVLITPADDEYHARSKAKLQWYARWGR